jgi:hypothetical protein
MRLLAAIQPPDATKAILDCLELPSRAPPTAAGLGLREMSAGSRVEGAANRRALQRAPLESPA